MTLNDKIKALCEHKGLRFKPYEFPAPWDVEDGETCPYPANSAGAEWWPRLMAIRAQLIKEIRI